MEIPLLQRGYHFLRKAGLQKFTAKTLLWMKTYLDQFRASARDRTSDAELQQKLSHFTPVDGHVTIPVLDFTMKVRVNDPGLSKDLILHGIRERDAVEYLAPHLPRCKSIIEIGANQGFYLLQEARLSPEDAHIYAFEPHPENVRTAELNVELNGIVHKCSLFQAAISDRRGRACLNVSKRSNWHSLARPSEHNLELLDETIEVETLTIDDVVAKQGIERVDLIRMDVEGHEAAVIRGAKKTIASSPGMLIFLEFHTSLLRQAGESPEAFLNEMKGLGLRCLTVCGKARHLVEPPWDELIRSLELITARYGTHMFFIKNSVASTASK